MTAELTHTVSGTKGDGEEEIIVVSEYSGRNMVGNVGFTHREWMKIIQEIVNNIPAKILAGH